MAINFNGFQLIEHFRNAIIVLLSKTKLMIQKKTHSKYLFYGFTYYLSAVFLIDYKLNTKDFP